MKIALLTDGIYPYVLGGMQRHSFYLAKYLAAEGHKVELYHMNRSKYDITKLDVFTEAERLNIRSYVVKFPSMGKSPGHYIRESYEYARRVYSLFKQNAEGVDFIIAKGFAGWEVLHQKSQGFQCAPVAVNFHGYEMFQLQPSLIARLQAKFVLRRPVLYNVKQADYLFSYGGKITSIIKDLGVAEKRIIEIPTGISDWWLAETPAPETGPLRFLFTGRYERRKGIEELNSELKKWLRENPAIEFHFIGPIPEKKKIKHQAVVYHGAITEQEKLRTLYREAHVLVCPSYAEGMPNVILEGMASGCMVIATDVGATALLVNKETGLLIPPADKNALGAALRRAQGMSGEERMELRTAALQTVKEKYLWKTVIQQVITEIEKRIVS
jgi:glycosyltransferase involved in cell wall biosynthesis